MDILPDNPDSQAFDPSTQVIAQLRRSLLDDLFKDLDSAGRAWLRKLIEPFVWPSATRFARIAATFDLYVERYGFRAGMQRILPNFVNGFEASGVEHVPTEGPLLVISNHPGTYDSLAIAAALPREDLNIVAFNFPLLQRLPSARKHLIFVSHDINERMRVIRTSIRHLEHGGALLIFPSGRVEPDPACLPGAGDATNAWSPSLELFLRRVPETKVLVTIVSGVLSPVFLNSRLIRFWRRWRDPQTVAEAIQVVVQMVFPNKVHLMPRIWFDLPMTIEQLQQAMEDTNLFSSIAGRARYLLDSHVPGLVNPKQGERLLEGKCNV